MQILKEYFNIQHFPKQPVCSDAQDQRMHKKPLYSAQSALYIYVHVNHIYIMHITAPGISHALLMPGRWMSLGEQDYSTCKTKYNHE